MAKTRFTDKARYPAGYTPSYETSIWDTFRRIRREQAAAIQLKADEQEAARLRDEANEAEAQEKVVKTLLTRTA